MRLQIAGDRLVVPRHGRVGRRGVGQAVERVDFRLGQVSCQVFVQARRSAAAAVVGDIALGLLRRVLQLRPVDQYGDGIVQQRFHVDFRLRVALQDGARRPHGACRDAGIVAYAVHSVVQVVLRQLLPVKAGDAGLRARAGEIRRGEGQAAVLVAVGVAGFAFDGDVDLHRVPGQQVDRIRLRRPEGGREGIAVREVIVEIVGRVVVAHEGVIRAVYHVIRVAADVGILRVHPLLLQVAQRVFPVAQAVVACDVRQEAVQRFIPSLVAFVSRVRVSGKLVQHPGQIERLVALSVLLDRVGHLVGLLRLVIEAVPVVAARAARVCLNAFALRRAFDFGDVRDAGRAGGFFGFRLAAGLGLFRRHHGPGFGLRLAFGCRAAGLFGFSGFRGIGRLLGLGGFHGLGSLLVPGGFLGLGSLLRFRGFRGFLCLRSTLGLGFFRLCFALRFRRFALRRGRRYAFLLRFRLRFRRFALRRGRRRAFLLRFRRRLALRLCRLALCRGRRYALLLCFRLRLARGFALRLRRLALRRGRRRAFLLCFRLRLAHGDYLYFHMALRCGCLLCVSLCNRRKGRQGVQHEGEGQQLAHRLFHVGIPFRCRLSAAALVSCLRVQCNI